MRVLAVLTTAVALSTMAGALPASAQSSVSVTMTASPNPAAYGAAVTLSAELLGQGDGAPLGSVAFRRAGTSLGTAAPMAAGANVGRIDSGFSHTCAFDPSGVVKCFGYNGFGQLGFGSYGSSAAPLALSSANGLTDPVVQIAGGNLHGCALTDVGGVWCWGYNGNGQLGNGTNLTSGSMISPTEVFASGVIAISSGNLHSCAVLDTGALRCWGDNTSGQIGDGTTTERDSPTEPTGASSGFVAVAAGHSHTCALTTTGTVKCWGAGAYGQMGNGTGNGVSVPTAVSNLTDVTRIVAGSHHTCAIDSGVTLHCWGFNGNGELGIDSTSNAWVPTAVGLADIADFAAGHDGTCALTTAGAAYCWGRNTNGQIGDGTTTTRTIPTAVTGAGSGIVGVSAASGFNCLLKADGSIACMGFSDDGRLGDGSAWVGIRSVAALTIDAATAATSLPAGMADLDAVFTPTSNHLTATSAAVSHTVTPIAATLALTATPGTAKFGQTVTLTATAGAAAGTPSGTVTFKRGSTTIAAVALSGGVAQHATATLPVGTHSVTAIYGGSNSHNGVTSSAKTVTVVAATTATTLAAIPALVHPDEAITVTATVAVVAPGAGTPTGVVDFKSGTTVLASKSLAAGTATTTVKLATGSHVLTAEYRGSTNFAADASPARNVLATYAKSAGDTELAPFRPIQRALAGATLASGSAVLAWETLTSSTAPVGIAARRVSTTGTASGAEIAVAAPAAGAGGPQVAGLSNGTFVVVWHSGTGSAREIFMRRYSSAGSPLGAAVQVNTVTAGDQSRPAVAAVSTTGYVVVWQSSGADGSGFGILQRRYTLAGVALGDPTAVNSTTAGDQTRPAVAGLTNGDTAVAFASPSGTGTAVRVRRFDPTGVARGADGPVTGVLTAIPEAAIHPLAAGAFAVAWTQPDTAGAAIRDAMMQRYTAAGAKTGGPTRLDTVTAGTQADPSMAFLDEDRLAVAWTGPDSAQEGVRAQAFKPSSGARVGTLIPVAADETGRALGPVALRLGDGTTWLAAWAQTIAGQGDKIMIRRFDRP